MEGKITRKGSTPIKVWCLPEERAQIEANARAAGQSLSMFLRNVGAGYPIRSVLDHQRVDDLARINGDLGRLGGLLKLWLTNDEKLRPFGVARMQRTLLSALEEIEANQEALREVMKTVVRS